MSNLHIGRGTKLCEVCNQLPVNCQCPGSVHPTPIPTATLTTAETDAALILWPHEAICDPDPSGTIHQRVISVSSKLEKQRNALAAEVVELRKALAKLETQAEQDIRSASMAREGYYIGRRDAFREVQALITTTQQPERKQ